MRILFTLPLIVTIFFCANFFAMEDNDTIVNIGDIKTNLFKRSVSEDSVEAELNDLEQGNMNGQKDDKKILEYLINEFNKKISQELAESLAKQLGVIRKNNPDQYRRWLLLCTLKQNNVTRTKNGKSKKSNKGVSLQQILQDQTALHALYLQAFEDDRELKHE